MPRLACASRPSAAALRLGLPRDGQPREYHDRRRRRRRRRRSVHWPDEHESIADSLFSLFEMHFSIFSAEFDDIFGDLIPYLDFEET